MTITTTAGARCERDGHSWARTGVYEDGRMLVFCTRPECEAAMREVGFRRWRLEPTGHGMQVGDIRMDLDDDPIGGVAKLICHEIAHDYRMTDLDLRDGDLVLDIGAHVGVVSTCLALRYPGVRIVAYEPVPANYERLCRNVRANGVVDRVIPRKLAVTGDGAITVLHGALDVNTGGSSVFVSGGERYETFATTLGQEIDRYGVPALLKIDCEGCEYDVLAEAGPKLSAVRYLVGEFHENDALRERGLSAMGLLAQCRAWMPDAQLQVTICEMGR